MILNIQNLVSTMTLFHLCGKQNYMRKLQTKLKKLTNRSWSVSWEYRILKIRQLIVGWINYYWIGNFMGVCRKLDKQIKFRIRMCLWKKWKTNKSREKQLIKLGVLPWQAKTQANCRESYARCASTFLQTKITNNLLYKKGLPLMVVQYQLKHISIQI